MNTIHMIQLAHCLECNLAVASAVIYSVLSVAGVYLAATLVRE